MFTVTLPTSEMAKLVSDIIRPYGVRLPRVDGVSLSIDAEALEILAEIDETQDGHYDGTHIWISGTEYHVTDKSA